MKAALAWAVRNPVFANLLTVFLLVAGTFALFGLKREMFPEFSFDSVVVTGIYPGAAPEEMEETFAIKVEEAVRGLEGVRKVESVSQESTATVTIEIDADEIDPREALVDVRNEVSRITTFPADLEEPQIRLITNRRQVMTVTLAGPLEEASVARLAREVEQELLLLPEIAEVTVSGTRDYEISIWVREADLQRYGLSFDQVAAAVRDASLDLPLGKLRSSDEEVLLRVESQRHTGREYAEIPVLVREDGTRVLLEDVARIHDGFDEDETRERLDGERAVSLQAMCSDSSDTVHAAAAVRAYVDEKRPTLPEGVRLEVWKDESDAVNDRLSLLARNGAQGLVLVFACLLIFLGVRLSFWVAFGLPVAFLTAMILLLAFGGSLNMISSFALIMILGILVDDSIVVAENVARHLKEGGHSLESAIRGVHEVMWPVVTSVTTTAIAFLPLYFLTGIMGKFIQIMPVAVVACLIASLIECLLILPAHLAHGSARPSKQTLLQRVRAQFDGWFDRFIDGRYGPSLDWSLRNRYVVSALSVAFVILVLGMAASGRPAFVFFPALDAEQIAATITMPEGTSLRQTAAVADAVERLGLTIDDDLELADDGQPIVRRSLTTFGSGGTHKAKVTLELAASNQRSVKGTLIIQRWKEALAELPAAAYINVDTTRHGPGGKAIELRVMGQNPEHTQAAALRIKDVLGTYPGVYNAQDNLQPGKREIRFRLRPQADALGLRTGDMARQLQAGFTGRETHTLQRGPDEVEVRVRYDPSSRQRIDQLGDLRLRTTEGLVPLDYAAEIERGRSLSKVERRDGRRVAVVSADIENTVTNPNQVVGSLEQEILPELREKYPGLEFSFGGQQEEQRETMLGLLIGFVLAVFGIYAILSLLFGSYIQALIVVGAIPVGFAGAILGHWVFGSPLTIFSIFGMVGLTGIVVNDALVLIDFVNRTRARGHTALDAAALSGRMRFRAVFLTTVTTVAGLLPILLERALTAQFIIPMAISIASGVFVATILTLYVVPCAYLILEDVRRFFIQPRFARGARSSSEARARARARARSQVPVGPETTP